MCGIAGYMNLTGNPVETGERIPLATMCDSIKHRGPDEWGMQVVGPSALGMTRLSIIDLSTGKQPISNHDDSVWIVFNGEIYNFQALKESLLQKGYKFKTGTDTEVILHLYQEHGLACLNHLEGMFAFAIFDKNKKRLLIARDRMGEKPLHYAIVGDHLVFCSEIKGILAFPEFKKEVDTFALRQYMALEYVPAPRSIFAGINKLPPASYLLVENGQIKTETYWQIPRTENQMGEQEALTRLKDLLDESIKLRLISDVPLGVFLSGGIDSSLITAMASKHVSHKLETFSIGFEEASFDESSHAQAVADHIGTSHTMKKLTSGAIVQSVSKLWEYLDEPLADASIIPTYLLSKMTKESVTVALSGDAGDELLGGYPTYLAHNLAGLFNIIPSGVLHRLINPMVSMLPVSHNNLSFDFKVKRFLGSVDKQAAERHFRWMGSIAPEKHKDLFVPEFRQKLAGAEPATYQKLVDQIDWDYFGHVGRKLGKGSLINNIMHLDLLTYLADDLLVKSDRASMAASLEVRVPFLAFPVVEFARQLPPDLKLKGFRTKYLLRKLASQYLPESIVERPKKGFGIPVARWLQSDLKPLVDRLLSREYIGEQNIFQWDTVSGLLDDHMQKRADRRKELWTMLMFQCWWDKYFADGRCVSDELGAKSSLALK
ncbi:MAG: asparagine synthase (glutamine-hydrolyzing) [Candidatus Melainabacteria bacterium]|nr:asparagine synthase (glutamine-hydrolyzing) [Candidatus Melainabacteria bacterium]